MAEKFPSDYDATSPFVPRGRGILLSGSNNGATSCKNNFVEELATSSLCVIVKGV